MSWLTKIVGLFQSNHVRIYTAIGDDECMEITGKLSDARIQYRTKAKGMFAGGNRRDLGFDTTLSEYDIYVRKDDKHKGRMAIERH